ncbi:retroviral-like aspartic protease [Candidatus Daviesbacteria bacterium]|nr:retroviral-like aspartic protease [Candidatus Daviesbacteria bacterium]
MKFKYRELSLPAPFSKNKNLLRPIIPISLKSHGVSIRYEGLIDSGADFCIFPTGIAKKLGINFKKMNKIYFSSASGDMIEGIIAAVILDIGKTSFKVKVVFADLAGRVGILGQYGFFDKFTVKFDLGKEEIEIKSII